MQPLPFGRRWLAGETPGGYLERLAAANSTTADQIAAAAGWRLPLPLPAAAPAPLVVQHQQAQLARLGGTHAPHPATIAWTATPRPLCLRCTGTPQASHGHPHPAGLICLKHRCTLSDTPISVAHLPAALTAERAYRRSVAGQAPYGSPIWTTAADLAATIDGWFGPPRSPVLAAVLAYPLTIHISHTLTNPTHTALAHQPDNQWRPDTSLAHLQTRHLLPGQEPILTRQLLALLTEAWTRPGFIGQLAQLGHRPTHTARQRHQP